MTPNTSFSDNRGEMHAHWRRLHFWIDASEGFFALHLLGVHQYRAVRYDTAHLWQIRIGQLQRQSVPARYV